MEEIKVGEYVRTDIGNIFQYEGKTKKIIDEYISVSDNQNIEFLGKIEKHSKNIIELIEVGDIVNSYIVLDVMEDLQTGEIQLEMPSSYPKEGSCTIYNNEIKTILTKEQYMQNCFKLD